jgi:hypothetical protein
MSIGISISSIQARNGGRVGAAAGAHGGIRQNGMQRVAYTKTPRRLKPHRRQGSEAA